VARGGEQRKELVIEKKTTKGPQIARGGGDPSQVAKGGRRPNRGSFNGLGVKKK